MKHNSFQTWIILITIFVLLPPHLVSSENIELEDQDSVYLGNSQHMFLSTFSSFTRSLKKDQVDYYEAIILPTDDKLTIVKEVSVGNVELFVSLDPSNEYPTEKLYNYTTNATNRDWIELDPATICVANPDQIYVIYVAVIPQGTSASYSLSIKRLLKKNSSPSNATQLVDGKKLFLPLPANRSVPEAFYFYAIPLEPTLITVKLTSEYPSIYVKILDKDTDISSLANDNLPTPSSYNYTSNKEGYFEPLNSVNVTIPALSSETPMLVAIAVYFDGTSSREKEYSILMNIQLIPIELGIQHRNIVHANKYKYVLFEVQDPEIATLCISLKSLDEQELSIHAESRHDEFSVFEWARYEERTLYGSRFFQINLHHVKNARNSFADTWAIGVHGKNTSEFTIFVTSFIKEIIELEPDNPTNLILNDHYRYFIYEPKTKNPIHIRTKSLPDSRSLYIRQASKDEDFLYNLPTRTNYQWSKAADIDRDACNDCYYIIAIEGHYEVLTEITISEKLTQMLSALEGSLFYNEISPGASNIIEFSHFVIQEVYLIMSSTAEKLELYTSNDSNISTTNFLWNTELRFDNETKVFGIPRIVPYLNLSGRPVYEARKSVSLYMQIKNPTEQQINYTLMMIGTPELMLHDYDLPVGPQDAKAVVFNITEESEIIEFTVSMRKTNDTGYQSTVEPSDLDVKAYYWSEEGSGIPATSVPLSMINVIPQRSNDYKRMPETMGYQQQVFKTNSKKGKFLFLYRNVGNTTLNLGPMISFSTNEIPTIESNSQVNISLPPGVTQTYQIGFSGPGAWYLWGYHCQYIPVVFRIQNGTDGETNATRVDSSRWSFYKATIGEGDTVQIISITPYMRYIDEYVLKSTFIPGAIAYDYDIEPYDGMNVSTQENTISVRLNPFIFSGIDISQDTLFYEILVCPSENWARYACPPSNTSHCLTQKSEEFLIQEPEQRTMNMTVQQTGKYDVTAKAYIKIQGHEIRFVALGTKQIVILSIAKPVENISESIKIEEETNELDENFETEEPTVTEPLLESSENLSSSSWSVWSIIGIIAAIPVVGLISYKCLKRPRYQPLNYFERM